MLTLVNKRILLGVSGGIAAYKSADLVRRLQDAGAQVRVVMTKAAQEFITPLTMQALSGNPVHTELLNPEAEAGMGHIELARWADVLLIAPATADIMARLCAGRGDDLLTTIVLATKAPVAIAPAMNQAMWSHSSTQDNLTQLKAKGVHIYGPASGLQACGDLGLGRMEEPVELVRQLSELFETGSLAGKRVTITAGPTREAIDPVRFISNHSSGKMGYALAAACAEAGAHTVLISGPTQLAKPERVERIDVISAADMLAAAHRQPCDIFIAAAAVADYRPEQIATQKLKKNQQPGDTMHLSLVKNPDIVASISALPNKPFTVGFAAETQQLEQYARDKLVRKNLDLVVANDVSRTDIGFNSDNNAVILISASDSEVLDARSKQQLARDIVVRIAKALATDPVALQ